METKTYKLKDIAVSICDGVHNTVLDNENGDCFLLSAKNIKNGIISFDQTDRKIDKSTRDKLSKRTNLSKGDVLVTTVGTVGELAIVDENYQKYEFQRSVGIIKCNLEIVLPQYLYYLLKTESYNYYLHVVATGAAQPCIFLSTLKNIKVKLPNLRVQSDVISVLSNYDKLIQNYKKQIEDLQNLASEIYKEWFVRFRFPGHEKAILKNGKPVCLTLSKVGNYAKVRSGYAFKSQWWQKTGFPVVKIKDIDSGEIKINDLDCVAEEHTQKAKTFLLKEGDLVIAMTGATIGKIGISPRINNLYTNQRVGKFFLGEEPYKKLPFLYCLFSQQSTLETVYGYAGASSAQPNISPEQLENIRFLGNNELIYKFNLLTEPAFRKIGYLRNLIKSITTQRDLLLPRLMSGKLEVK